MASSPPASPALGMSPTLSPRSRLQAALAAADSGSDDDSDVPSPPSKPRSHVMTDSAPTITKPTPTVDSSDDEQDAFRPRGRLAARMHAQSRVAAADSDDEPAADARERVRRLLQREEAANTTSDAEMGQQEGEADEEDNSPTRSGPLRRLKQRQARESTPSSAQKADTQPSPASSGLFVSPNRPDPLEGDMGSIADANAGGSDDDLVDIASITQTNRFKALVERKRQERLAREAEQERLADERYQRQLEMTDPFEEPDNEGGDGDDDDDILRETYGEKRSQRKASKKALEEMNRETQRLARNMHLAHEARTRKKMTKNSLFERFNFRPEGSVLAEKPGPKMSSSSRPGTPNSAHQTDVEMRDHETPPSSPPVDKAKTPETKAAAPTLAVNVLDDTQEMGDLPELGDILSGQVKLDKGKGKALEVEEESTKASKAAKPKRNIRVKLPATQANIVAIDLDDDDDELEVSLDPRMRKLDAIFDKAPSKATAESRGLQTIRQLAMVASPPKDPSGKNAMTVGDMQAMLQQRAREQAKVERDRRMEILRSKGIVVQTAEERERQMEEVDDIVARARREAEEIMQRERDAAKEEKKANRANGTADPLAWDSSEDEDYEGSESEQDGDAEAEIELSGSDEEGGGASVDNEEGDGGVDDEEEEAEEEELGGGNPLFDEAADETMSEASEPAEEDEGEETKAYDEMDEDGDEENLPARAARRPKHMVAIVSDDEDEVEVTPRPKTTVFKSPAPGADSPAVPTSVLRSATKPFIPGMPVAGPAGMGLTQIFAGTMDDSQLQQPASGGVMASPMPSFGFGAAVDLSATQPILDAVADSQPEPEPAGSETQLDSQDVSQPVLLHYSQSQMHGFDSLLRDDLASQMSELEATQDGGLTDYTPLKERFIAAPASTVDTVVVPREADEEAHDSPLVRRGRLRRKLDVLAAADEEEDNDEDPTPLVESEADDDDDAAAAGADEDEDEFGFGTTNIYEKMRDAAERREKRRLEIKLSKKKSRAKAMVEEQAEESEDEYAGLGGADGEDSEDEDAASVKDMIDDDAGDVDERKIAAFYADRERADDEKQVDKLFRDITTGMLRRKRGADYDLSDSDDGGEARKRMKRRQFAKMQRALFADERIKKIAENPGNQAFLRTIEDRGSDDDEDEDDAMDFFDHANANANASEGASGSAAEAAAEKVVPDSQPEGRRVLGSAGGAQNARRRGREGKRPSHIGEIRESLSSLLDEPMAVIPATDPQSDSDADEPPTSSNKENADTGNAAGAAANARRKAAVVDRISLKRQSSSTVSASTTARLAFAAPSAATTGFKVPALLRRATTNSLMSTTSSSTASSTTSVTGGGGGGRATDSFGRGENKIRKGAGKRSGVSYLARENERRAALSERESRREAKKFRGAEKRVKAVGGLFGAGKFE